MTNSENKTTKKFNSGKVVIALVVFFMICNFLSACQKKPKSILDGTVLDGAHVLTDDFGQVYLVRPIVETAERNGTHCNDHYHYEDIVSGVCFTTDEGCTRFYRSDDRGKLYQGIAIKDFDDTDISAYLSSDDIVALKDASEEEKERLVNDIINRIVDMNNTNEYNGSYSYHN